jgi:hypothetical protein
VDACAQRGLAASGTKDVLVSRLKAAVGQHSLGAAAQHGGDEKGALAGAGVLAVLHGGGEVAASSSSGYQQEPPGSSPDKLVSTSRV